MILYSKHFETQDNQNHQAGPFTPHQKRITSYKIQIKENQQKHLSKIK